MNSKILSALLIALIISDAVQTDTTTYTNIYICTTPVSNTINGVLETYIANGVSGLFPPTVDTNLYLGEIGVSLIVANKPKTTTA